MPNSTGSDIMKVGDYKLKKLTIQSLITNARVDLSRVFTSIEIYEDMFAPYLSAKLYIEDSLNWPEKLPITGQERVELIFKTDIDSIEDTSLSFRVYKLDSQEIDNRGESQTYTLHLISEGGYLNFSQSCGYAVSGKTSDMVRKIFMNNFPNSVWGKRLQIEDTTDNYSFILPMYYSPFTAIQWLCTKAINKTGKNYSPYFFYETMDGYCYKSLSYIIKEGMDDILPYFYTSPNVPTNAKNSPYSSILPAGYHRIQKLKETNRFDMMEDIMNGTFSSLLMVHDLLRKQKRESLFREQDIFTEKTKLGKGVRFRESDPEANRIIKRGSGFFYLPSTPFTAFTKNNPIIDNTQIEKTHLPRNYHVRSILTQSMIIDIFGDNRKRVGQIVRIFVPKISAEGHLQDDKSDENLSGEFVVTAIKHTLNTVYSCTLELSRNCMGVE